MGFDTIFRKMIGVIDKTSSSLQVPVTHYPWIDSGDYSEPKYGLPITRLAVVDFSQRLHRMSNGQEIMQRASITFPRPIEANGAKDRKEPIDSRDKLVLANGYSGPILDVEGVLDPSTNLPYSVQVILG